MAAWVDCLTYADSATSGMVASPWVVPSGDVLNLQLDEVDTFMSRCPEQFDTIVDWAAFVNWRRIEAGERPIITLSFFRHQAG